MSKVEEVKEKGNLKKYANVLCEIEDAQLLYPNFQGRERPPYNKAGSRNFCVMLSPEKAKEFEKMGLNVKYSKPIDKETLPFPFLKINVYVNKEKGMAPKIVLINDGHKKLIDSLSEKELFMLDFISVITVDVRFRTYIPAAQPNMLSTALTEIYIQMKPDKFEKKYENVPESAKEMMFTPNKEIENYDD